MRSDIVDIEILDRKAIRMKLLILQWITLFKFSSDNMVYLYYHKREWQQ